MKKLKTRLFWSVMLFTMCMATFISCTTDESRQRKEYWTDSNYPKYGIVVIRDIPDSMHQQYLETIKALVMVGREDADFIPENSLKYAKEVADQLYLKDMEGLGIYLGQFQRAKVPYYQLDSTQRVIFNHLKFGTPQDTIKVMLK